MSPRLLKPDGRWQLPWLHLHLVIRDIVDTPWGKRWPDARVVLKTCADLRDKLLGRGWFN
jgi:hypothetical protein